MVGIPRFATRPRTRGWFYTARALIWGYALGWTALFLVILLAPRLDWWLKALALAALVPGLPRGADLVLSYSGYLAESSGPVGDGDDRRTGR